MDAMKYFRYAGRCLVRGRAGQLIDGEFQVPDWDVYKMDIHRPFEAIESTGKEVRIVGEALSSLVAAGILSSTGYDLMKYQAMRDAVCDVFEIPWTAITPRMQRLIYAINAIRQPAVMIAAGVFCGDTFISNAGAAVGPGAVYAARALIGLEINPAEAERAERNIRRIDHSGLARVEARDAVAFCDSWNDEIDLLYLDADGDGGRGKAIYLDITQKAWAKMPSGALLLAHNSINSAREMKNYLAFVRDRAHCRASVNVVLDSEGLEVSIK